MNYLKIIAIFCAPVFGTTLIKKDKLTGKEIILRYVRYLTISNLVTTFIIYILDKNNELIFTVPFFIKYTTLNIGFSILIALIEMASKKNVEVDLNVKKQKS